MLQIQTIADCQCGERYYSSIEELRKGQKEECSKCGEPLEFEVDEDAFVDTKMPPKWKYEWE